MQDGHRQHPLPGQLKLYLPGDWRIKIGWIETNLIPIDENIRFAAHAYIILAAKQKGTEKRTLLETAGQYYKKMNAISKESQENLDKI